MTKGLKCSACGTRLVVTTSRNTAAGIVRRYRHCPKCKSIVATEERILSERFPKKTY